MFEIYPIVAAAQVWGHLWVGQTVFFSTDNQVTSEIINNGRSKSLLIMGFVRRLVWLSLHFNFHLHCRFVNGAGNVAADALSGLISYCFSSRSQTQMLVPRLLHGSSN